MSRRPRAGAAADNRVTIRMTDRELADAQRLAANARADLSTFVRRLLADEHARRDFVDAQHSSGPRRLNTVVWNVPPFVFTLHAVPGRAEPLCVRRRVVNVDGVFAYFEYARNRHAGLDLDCLDGDGSAATRGYERHDRWEYRVLVGRDQWGPKYEYVQRDAPEYGVEPSLRVYVELPSPAARARWIAARARLRGLAGRDPVSVWACWNGSVRRFDLRPKRECERGEDWHRGDYVGRFEPRAGIDVNLFNLAWTGHTQASRWSGPRFDGNSYSSEWGDAKVDVWLDEPSDETKAAAILRAREAEAKRRRERAEQLRRSQPADVCDALEHLGLDWPVDIETLNRAQRERAKTEHPDRGGSNEAMRRTNDAAARLRRHIHAQGIAAA